MAKRQNYVDVIDARMTDHRSKMVARAESDKERQYHLPEEYDEEELYAFDDPKLYRVLQGR